MSGGAPTSTVVTVSPLRRRHLPSVTRIEAEVFPRPWSPALFEDELTRPRRAYLVARVGAEVVGYAGVLLIADDGHVATVAVDPAWQGRGIATRLLVELFERARHLGAEQVTLEVRVGDRRAQSVYRRFGFAPAGMRKGYYPDGEDALVMWAHDVRGAEHRARLDAIVAELEPPTVRTGFDDVAAPRAVHPALDGGRMDGS